MALDYSQKLRHAEVATNKLLSSNVRLVRQLDVVHQQLAKTDVTIDQLTTNLVAQERRIGELAIATAQLDELAARLAALEVADCAFTGKNTDGLDSESFMDECQRLEATLSGLTSGVNDLFAASFESWPNECSEIFEASASSASGGIRLHAFTNQQQKHAALSTPPTSTNDTLNTSIDTSSDSNLKEMYYHDYNNINHVPPVLQFPDVHRRQSISNFHAIGTTSSGLSDNDYYNYGIQQHRTLRRFASLPLKYFQNKSTTPEAYTSEDYFSLSPTTVTSFSAYSDEEDCADYDHDKTYDIESPDKYPCKATAPSLALVSKITASVTTSSMCADQIGGQSKPYKNSQQQCVTDGASSHFGSSGTSGSTQIIKGLLSRHESKRSSEVGLVSMSQVSAEFALPVSSLGCHDSVSGADLGHKKVVSKASQLLNQTIAEHQQHQNKSTDALEGELNAPSLNKKLSSFFNKFV